jgi:Rieske Fe-S protein
MSRRTLVVSSAALAVVSCGGLLAGLSLLSLRPSHDKGPSHYQIQLERIAPGTYIEVEWLGRPVVIVRPDHQMVEDLKSIDPFVLGGVALPNGDIPGAFVYERVSTHKGCGLEHVPAESPLAPTSFRWRGGWRDACHIGYWDYAGRAVRTDGRAVQLANLVSPEYTLIGNRIDLKRKN